jgi:flagellar protein FlgJ
MQVSATTASTTTASATLDKPHQQLKQACQQFEGYFLDMMFKEMRKTVPSDPLLGDQDNQQQIFTGMMDQTLADAMSQRGDLGLSQMLYNQMAPTLGTTASSSLPGKASDDSSQ